MLCHREDSFILHVCMQETEREEARQGEEEGKRDLRVKEKARNHRGSRLMFHGAVPRHSQSVCVSLYRYLTQLSLSEEVILRE